MNKDNTQWDYEYDLIAIGSGCAGMTAALVARLNGLNPLIIEKSPHYGGSTALSGGEAAFACNADSLSGGSFYNSAVFYDFSPGFGLFTTINYMPYYVGE